jgi:hypothetical protein
MRDLQKSSKFGTERRITLGYLGAGTVSFNKSPGGFVDNPGRAFFLFTHALGPQALKKKLLLNRPQFMHSNPDCTFPATSYTALSSQ